MISDDLIKKTLEKINKTTAAYNYFFNNINNPEWLLPLKEAGFFTSPTPAIRKDGFVHFPVWPESGYLLRIADQAPDEVLDIIKNLPETDNERVMDDVVNALIKIDASKAFRLTELVKKYTNSSRFLMLHQTTAEFICKLADSGYDRPALGLAKEMLEVMPDPEKEEKLKSDYVMIKPTTKYRDHDYEFIADKITQSLAKASPLSTIDMYADLLQKAIEYELTFFKEDGEEVALEDKKDDLTYISRPDIGEDSEYGSDVEDTLITALRDSVVALMRSSSLSDLEKLEKLKELATKKYSVYRRIVEYALRDHKENKTFKHFYNALIKDKKLKTILENESKGVGKVTSGMVTERPTDLLKGLPDTDLIEKLKSYKDESFWTFERDSMSKELGALVKLDPVRFVPLIKQIASTKNEYFDETIRALEESVDSLDEKNINELLTSLKEIFTHGNEVKESERHEYYTWSKASAVQLIEKLVSKREDKSERVTIKSLGPITDLLLLLCRDSDPLSKDDANFEPVDLSINSNRGKALHGAAYLLHWMSRNKVDEELYKPVFDELDWHLLPENDPVPAMRAVYGWRFEVLYGANEDWTVQNIDKIFSDDELGNAAFDAYVMFNRVHEEALKVLGDVFRRQLPRLSTEPANDRNARHDGLKNFVQHLAMHYWYSTLDLSKDSLMSVLLKDASKTYMKELANSIGFRLYKTKDTKVESAQIIKLAQLWEAIVKAVGDDKDRVEVLEEFGGWFASEKFDPKWALEQLTYAASKVNNISLDFKVLEYLEKLANEYPEESLKALSIMVDRARDRWAVSSWKANTTGIIQTAAKSSNKKAQEQAKALANKLVANGYTEYRNIL